MSFVAFMLGMFVVLLADAVSEWLYAKADEIREDTERRRAERIRMERVERIRMEINDDKD